MWEKIKKKIKVRLNSEYEGTEVRKRLNLNGREEECKKKILIGREIELMDMWDSEGDDYCQ
jgi:hypothetical protein